MSSKYPSRNIKWKFLTSEDATIYLFISLSRKLHYHDSKYHKLIITESRACIQLIIENISIKSKQNKIKILLWKAESFPYSAWVERVSNVCWQKKLGHLQRVYVYHIELSSRKKTTTCIYFNLTVPIFKLCSACSFSADMTHFPAQVQIWSSAKLNTVKI